LFFHALSASHVFGKNYECRPQNWNQEQSNRHANRGGMRACVVDLLVIAGSAAVERPAIPRFDLGAGRAAMAAGWGSTPRATATHFLFRRELSNFDRVK